MQEQHSFGYWLRLKRKALDLTREALADRVGCSVSTIRKLEDEERHPSAQIAELLAEIFKIPPTERPAFLRFRAWRLEICSQPGGRRSPLARLNASTTPTTPFEFTGNLYFLNWAG